MFLKILSLGGPFWAYATIAVLTYGLFLERKRFEWPALVLGVAGLFASALFLAPIHRVFFDEDTYINIASNLTRAPVNQVTMMGGPQGIQISSYPKEPAGWPVLLSFAFLVGGPSEAVAYWFSRLLFAFAIAAVYQLARALLPDRRQALIAAILFGATPICFWYSVSVGTDMTSALMAALGMWGLVIGNGPLATAGLAFAAQTRMELLLVVPLVWLSPRISLKWKIAGAGLALFEIVHVTWIMSVARVLEKVEQVQSAFGMEKIGSNLFDNIKYLFNPFTFPIILSALAIFSICRTISTLRFGRRRLPEEWVLVVWMLGLFAVYLSFYAGSFNTNPRYSIQIVPAMAVLAAAPAKRFSWILALIVSLAIPAVHRYEPTPIGTALEADHQLSIEFASKVSPDDLIVSGVQQIFLDNGRRAINAPYAATHGELLKEAMGTSRRVWYHSGIQANRADTDEWRADRWVKSNFELHPIDSHEVRGFRIAFYEILTNTKSN